MIHTAVLCLGSNVAAASGIITEALDSLAASVGITGQSSMYCGDDDSGLGEPYINVVVKISTTMTRQELSRLIASLERRAGRLPESKPRGIMPLDIDIVLWDGAVISAYDYERPYFTRGYEAIK